MQEPISGDSYCTAEGHDGVYLIESEQADFFLLAKNDLLSLWVTPELALSSALSALQDVTFVFKDRPSRSSSIRTGGQRCRQISGNFVRRADAPRVVSRPI